MSHFTRIKTQMVEKEYLKRALTDLGYKFEEGALAISELGIARTPVEIKISTGFFGSAIGFRKTGGVYEMVAAAGLVRGINQRGLLSKLTQRYAYHAARAKLEEQGFALVTEETQNDGRIHLVLRRAA